MLRQVEPLLYLVNFNRLLQLLLIIRTLQLMLHQLQVQRLFLLHLGRLLQLLTSMLVELWSLMMLQVKDILTRLSLILLRILLHL